MNREIKFRVWEWVHERTSGEGWIQSPMVWKMNYSPSLFDSEVFGDWSKVNLNGALKNGGNASYTSKNPSVFMQFIGLTDMHGVDIYEGDRIRIHAHDFSHGFEETIHDICTRYVGEPSTHWEVIGNIYENPELLKEQ